MRKVVAYDAKIVPDGVFLSRHYNAITEQKVTNNWLDAVSWLVQPISSDTFTICYNLNDFTKALFSLLPEEKRQEIGKQDRIFFDNVKVFSVAGRYLGLTATIPLKNNIVSKEELNLQALKWWVSEEEDEPQDVKQVWELGTRIVKVLDDMGFTPTKLTSPVGVFADCYLGDARKYPTVFNFDDEKFGAMEYATEMMRYEWRSAYQIGMFPETHLYDLVSAYPSIIANLPSTNDCQCELLESRPEWANWGIMKGEVEVTSEISPLVFDLDGARLNPRGKFEGYFTTDEISWLERWGAGKFTIEDGWFFHFGKERPYQPAMGWMFQKKQNPDKLYSTIAKKMGQGVSGKLDEDRLDGKKGDFYNPVLASIVRSSCRLRVASFIYRNALQDNLIAVLVDSVLTDRVVSLPKDDKGMGCWRYEGSMPAVVLSKGQIWRPGKKPMGIGYEQLLDAMKSNPESGYYEFKTASGSVRAVDLLLGNSDPDRVYEDYPRCGQDVMSRIAKSKAIEL